MFNIFKRKKDSRVLSVMEKIQSNPAFQVHRKYWTFNQKEKERLLSKFPEAIEYKDQLRLLHLICLEYLNSEGGKEFLSKDDLDEDHRWEPDTRTICTQLITSLLDNKSPFCSKKCCIWQGETGESENREPDLQGDFLNASFSHLGCLEVIRVDINQNPLEVDFIPFDDIREIDFAQPSIYRAAKIFYDYEKEDEIVLSPSIYGLSWLSQNEFDHDGSMTRFCCSLGECANWTHGLGFGHQDFTVLDHEGNRSILGLSSIREIMIGLEITDSKFETKCKARGLNPQEVMEQMKA